MSAVFDALPGLDVPVDAISSNFAKMWDETAAEGGPSPADLKATQLNFVLHFGFATLPADALEQFQITLRFAQRYPCRVVVLCPQSPDDPATDMQAKIYGECFLGKSKGDTRCVEFVALSYPQAARRFLENEVSICLSVDLPLYYWAHRFSQAARLADYQYLLTRAKRVLIDGAIAPPEVWTYPWPRPEIVRDLVHARLLPVRQEIGQFLASYPPATLTKGLRGVTVTHRPEFAAEGRVLLGWTRERLARCGNTSGLNYAVTPRADGASNSLELSFDYGGGRRFRWQGDFPQGCARFEADFGGGPTMLPTAVSLLSPENALSEAIFF